VIQENIRRVVEWKSGQSQTLLWNIYEAVKALKSSQVKEIKFYLDQKASKEVELLYTDGIITKGKKPSELKKRTCRRETIQRNLKKLSKLGYIEHTDGKYSIVDFTKYRTTDPQFFGEILLQSLMQFPLRSKEKDIQEMIARFGIFIVLALLEASMPVSNSNLDAKKYDKLVRERYRPLTAKERDQLVLFWINKVIPVRYMFRHFQSIVSIDEDLSDEDDTIPSYEISLANAKKVLRVIKKFYPEEYKEMIKNRDFWTRKGEDIR